MSVLERCYAAAVAAAAPRAALRGPLAQFAPGNSPTWVIALGKGAHGMASTIVDWLHENDGAVAGGIVVSPDAGLPISRMSQLEGDHPVPGAKSARAAEAIRELIRLIPAGDVVHVAISGGASALVAAPLPGLSMADVTATFAALIGAGLDIHEMNAIRKRVSRWSAGRLALALAGRRLHVWLISDVPGDDAGTIASGPCSGDRWTSQQVSKLLTERGLLDRLPLPVRQALHTETPKPDDPRLAVVPKIVANNRVAMAAAADMAHRLGFRAQEMDDPLTGEAAAMGKKVADVMHEVEGSHQILIWGGETTVTLGDGSGRGGRSQELALSAARALHCTRPGGALLAAGTDGRDGPTDAAGAVVSAETWGRMVAAGRDPEADAARHDAYPALDAAGALLRTGSTGTNVMDLAIALTGAR